MLGRNNDLGNDSMTGLVFRLAIPSMFAQLVNVLYGIVDRMYIGNIPEIGGIALAGVGICAPLTTLISSFAFLIGIGGAPLTAMRLGEGNVGGAKKILANCALMLSVLSILLTAVFYAFKNPLLMLFGASNESIIYANQYMNIYLAGTFFAIMSVGLNQFIICQGFSGVGMLTVLVGAVTNIILDPIFIFACNMGVRGAALATIISQAMSCAFVLIFLRSPRVQVPISFGGYDKKIMKMVLIFGLSPFLIVATDSILILIMNSVLQFHGSKSGLGDQYITGATIVQSYFQLISMPLIGITGGTQPILSFNYGAKNTERIKLAYKRIFAMALGFTAIMMVASQILPQYFALIFTKNTALINLAVTGIRLTTLGVLPMALQYEVVDGFTALGVSKAAVSLSLLRKMLYLVLTLILPIATANTLSVFLSEPISDLICGLLSFGVYLAIIGKILKNREQAPIDSRLYE